MYRFLVNPNLRPCATFRNDNFPHYISYLGEAHPALLAWDLLERNFNLKCQLLTLTSLTLRAYHEIRTTDKGSPGREAGVAEL